MGDVTKADTSLWPRRTSAKDGTLEPEADRLPVNGCHHAQGHERHGEEELDQGCVGQGLAPRDQARRKIYLTADLFENSQSQTITWRGDGKSVTALNAVKGDT
ncbi:MAG: hypothetical protein RIT46_196 [Pseudomonadota bacterium]